MNKLGSIPVGNSNPIRIMGILNTSPESFYKQSIKINPNSIKNAVKQMECDGADFVDIGGMSTAPYLSTIVTEKEELKRVVTAIKIVQNYSNLPISIDTCRSTVAKSALELGVDIINDISGLKYDKKMIEIIEQYEPSLILCAFSKTPVKNNNPVLTTKNLLKQSMSIAKSANIPKRKIVLDPAIGFFRKSGKGKFFTKINSSWFMRDVSLLDNLSKIKQRQPILVSVSNKSFLKKILDTDDLMEILSGSLSAETFSVIQGADIIRTHNVYKTKNAIYGAQKLLKRIKKGL